MLGFPLSPKRHADFQGAIFLNWYSTSSILHKVMQHNIFKHPWPLTLVVWPWHKKCSCQFLTCIILSLSTLVHWPCCSDPDFENIVWFKSYLLLLSVMKMDVVTSYHIRLCNITCLSILGLWPWWLILKTLSISIHNVLMPAVYKWTQ